MSACLAFLFTAFVVSERCRIGAGDGGEATFRDTVGAFVVCVICTRF